MAIRVHVDHIFRGSGVDRYQLATAPDCIGSARLLIELAAFPGLLALQGFFSTAASMFAVAIAFIVADRYTPLPSVVGLHARRVFSADRLSKEQVQRVIAGDIPFDPEAKAYETTVVVATCQQIRSRGRCEPPSVSAKSPRNSFAARPTLLCKRGLHPNRDRRAESRSLVFRKPDAHHGDKGPARCAGRSRAISKGAYH